MTPMIDIVFQLIVFFVLTLRFKTLDERIDAQLPEDRGPAMIPVLVEDTRPLLRVKVFRAGIETPADARDDRTQVRVERSATLELPGAGADVGDAEALGARRAALERVRGELRRQRDAHGPEAGSVRVEIAARGLKGGAVPHGDVMALLDACLAEGLTEVTFEGTPGPR
jgi:hypothetical protein